MFGFRRKTQRAGRPISARVINQYAEVAERLSRLTAVPPLELVAGPAGYFLRLAAKPAVVPFRTASAVAAGSIGAPASFTATLLADDAAGAGALTTTGAGTTTFGRNEQTHPLLPGLTYWGVWRNGYLYSAAAAPPVCLGVTTSAITAATFGGADGSGTVTITYPDGSTASVSVGNRSTTAFATSKNAMCFWVPNKNKWYALVDC